jgi:hypothetical protein
MDIFARLSRHLLNIFNVLAVNGLQEIPAKSKKSGVNLG